MDNRVRIAVIGTGFARTVQIPAFLSYPDVEITAIASGTPGKAETVARQFGIPFYFDDWHLAIDRPDVDLVCITTPPDLHREMTLFAAGCGKHILCEKPMAMNTVEAQEMAVAVKNAKVMGLIDHELRFQPGRQEAYRIIRRGEIGKILHLRYIFQAPHRGDPEIKWNWWSDAARGGGSLGAIVSHIIDSFCWISGTEISEVTCRLHTHIKQRPLESGGLKTVTSDDESTLIFGFRPTELAPDATGFASVSMIAGPEYINRFEIFGTEGSIKLEHRGELFISKRGDAGWQQIDVALAPLVDGSADTGFSRGFLACVPSLAEAVKNGGKPPEFAATFDDGVRIQKVLDSARRSSRERITIKL